MITNCGYLSYNNHQLRLSQLVAANCSIKRCMQVGSCPIFLFPLVSKGGDISPHLRGIYPSPNMVAPPLIRFANKILHFNINLHLHFWWCSVQRKEIIGCINYFICEIFVFVAYYYILLPKYLYRIENFAIYKYVINYNYRNFVDNIFILWIANAIDMHASILLSSSASVISHFLS